MGKVIRGQRKGKGGTFTSQTRLRKGFVNFRKLDYTERHDYIKGVTKDIIHKPGRGAPMAKIQFQNPYKHKCYNELDVALESIYSGRFIYCGKKVPLNVSNILPVCSMPEGSIISSVQAKVGDRGTFARCSGDYAVLIAHEENKGAIKMRLPSGAKKIVSSDCRAMMGIVASGRRTDKPMLKARRTYHKFRVKRNEWPHVRGVAMNPVEHPIGGGNHQHIGHPSTANRLSSAGQKVGLIATRRTGRLRGIR
ncbi:unnamed protein product, partial [Ascophyllum nodosum]